MTTDDETNDEKVQYDINRETAKIWALSSGKIDKYEYLIGEEILSSDQRRIIEQAKFTYYLLLLLLLLFIIIVIIIIINDLFQFGL